MRTFFGQGRVLQMRTSALFGAKTRIFRNLWCIRTDKGGASADKRGGRVNFSRLCANIFYGQSQLTRMFGIYPSVLNRLYCGERNI